MQDLVIILPTHNRHDYLGSKIKYYADCGYEVYICDSTSNKFEYNKQMPVNISYLWMPGCGFYEKVLSTLNKVYSKLVILTPDDDFLDMDTLNECKSKMLADGNISLSVGVQVCFNEPYDGKWYIQPTANLLRGYDLSQDKMENAQIFGSHYQNVLWSLFRQDVICEAFKKLKRNNPKNGNFIEMTLACEATVSGTIYVSSNVLNYREVLTTRSHWGQEVPSISLTELAKDDNLQNELDTHISQYKGENRRIVKQWVNSYLEYGIINVFMSTVGIVQVLLTLNTEVAISRYYYDAKNEQDFKEFCSTSIKISSGVWLLMSLIMAMLNPWLAEELSFSKVLTLCMIPVATYSIINSIFIQIYQPLLRSKKVAIVSSVQSYLAFCLSVIFMLCMETERYYGYIWGTIAAMILLATYLTRQIRPFYVKSKINREHVKYLLSYSLPYIPYTLSGIILAQFGRIFMSTHGGFDAAGLYSFVSNVGALMMILISVGHNAWNPYYLQYMTNKDYKSIDKDYDLIWRATLIGAMGLTMFGNEIALIMARPEFLSGMYLLPILIIGYVFYQWSYVYLRSTGFAKRTIWNAVAILISGISNILLNHLLIDRFYILGVALSFCISYFILYAVAYLINRYVLKTYVPQSIRFIKPFFLLLLLMAVYQYVFGGEMNLWIKIPVFFILTCWFMWGYKSCIFKVLKFYH